MLGSLVTNESSLLPVSDMLPGLVLPWLHQLLAGVRSVELMVSVISALRGSVPPAVLTELLMEALTLVVAGRFGAQILFFILYFLKSPSLSTKP